MYFKSGGDPRRNPSGMIVSRAASGIGRIGRLKNLARLQLVMFPKWTSPPVNYGWGAGMAEGNHEI